MVTLTDTSADGKLEARYLNDRRGVLMRAKFTERVLYGWDFEPSGTPSVYPLTPSVPAKIRSSASYAGLTEATSIVPLPVGRQTGDLCYIGWNVISDVTTAAFTVPSGWTEVVAQFNASGSTFARHGVLKRVLQAGDPSTVTITHSRCRFSAVSVAIYDHDLVTPEDVAGASDNNSGVVTPNVRAPSVTAVTTDCLMLTFHAVRNGTYGQQTSITPASGMTEVNEARTTHKSSTNGTIELSQKTLITAGATGTRTAKATGSNVSSLKMMGSTILVRPSTPTPVGTPIGINGGFGWKNVNGTDAIPPPAQRVIANPPGNDNVAVQWCSTIFNSTGTLPVVTDTIAQVISNTGAATTATFNTGANAMIVASVGYNSAPGDALGDKITFTNNKGLTVVEAVERGNGDGGVRGGSAIAYMFSSGAQTGMTVTATLSGVNATHDDVVLKVIMISNIDSAAPIPDGTWEGSIADQNYFGFEVTPPTILQGVYVFAFNDSNNLGVPSVSIMTAVGWSGFGGTSTSFSATTPLAGAQSLLCTWATGGFGISHSVASPNLITGPIGLRLSFMILGTEALSSTWSKTSKERLEVRLVSTSSGIVKTNVLGFPGNVSRSWSTDFFLPAGVTLNKIEIQGYGWDSAAAARIDEIRLTEKAPEFVRFVRKTDGGYVRGGHPSRCIQGVAYAFDDELTPAQLTEWSAQPGFAISDPTAVIYGAETGTVEFTIEDRAVTLPSNMIKSIENAGMVMFLPTDQHQFTKGRSATFVNKQTTGKPAGGVNSAYSQAGDYVLITSTIPEMRDLVEILEETVLYISPTARYHKPPFFATVVEYTVIDFATMDDPHKTFVIRFQEVERPDTQDQPSYLPQMDYASLATQYAAYGVDALVSQTYDQLSFYVVP